MASGLNKVMLIGNLGRDPEVKYLEDGRGFAKFSIATSESYTDKSGQKIDQTEWHNISVWRPGLVGVVEKYVKKGDKVFIEGKLRTRSWEDETKSMRYITEIVVDNLTLLTPPNASAHNESESSAPTSQNNPKSAPATSKQNAQKESAPIENDNTDEDDLPF